MTRRFTAAALAALLTGCTVAPDYQRPAVDLPQKWPQSLRESMQQQADWAQWWVRYDDPVLARLVQDALASNLDVLSAAARIRQARAQLGFRRAEQYPTLDAQAQAARADPGQTQPGGDWPPQTTYQIAGVLNYEVDLWGRLSGATDVARAQLLQTVFSADAVRLGLITDVVTGYFNLRALQQQIQTTLDTIETRRAAYELEQANYRYGASAELTLRQAQAELAQAEAQLPALRNQAARVRRALAILAGRPPSGIVAPEGLPPLPLAALTFSTALPTRLPSELLERRPDLRAAEAGLIAANADIGVARASWLPRLNLVASGGSGATDLGDMFSGPAMLWQLGASVVTPLLDFGRRRADIETAEALRDLAELQYRATIRDAFREVGDAWTLLETASQRLAALNRQVEALQVAVDLAEKRYRNGYSPFLEVLDARRSLFTAQLAQTEAVRDRLIATAQLFKSLGGGWQAGAAPAAEADDAAQQTAQPAAAAVRGPSG